MCTCLYSRQFPPDTSPGLRRPYGPHCKSSCDSNGRRLRSGPAHRHQQSRATWVNCVIQVSPEGRESFQLLVLESCGWGIIHLKCLPNWMRILHSVSFFLLNQRNAQSRQWLYQRLSDKYQEHPDHSGVLGRLTGLFWMSTPYDCVNRESEFALWCIQILIH